MVYTPNAGQAGADTFKFRGVSEGTGPSVINRFNRRRMVMVLANMQPGHSSQAVMDLLNAQIAGRYRAGTASVDDLLDRAVLSRARMSGAELQRATLVRANLSRADLSEANLEDARLHGARLSDAQLR